MKEKTKIKICGLSRLCDIDYVNEIKPDYVGFVFAKSRRRISKEHALTLRQKLDPDIQAVGVFVNELAPVVAGYLESGIIDVAQLHGSEDEIYLHNLRLQTGQPIIKAFSVRNADDVKRACESTADYILLDHGKGGTGTAFDWTLVQNMKRPFFLAGGLGPENIEKAIADVHPFGVDISSGVETDGYKDYHKIQDCVRRIRNV
ncbi:MAG: phosphoribosylanthranilate isomerase [Fusicatenibacter sp.]|nr:phosphoribosylanthranilate isomerase [Lachnospiraceae bacterium]MDY2938206.1 phosphoribosylanthranilate isomerase [Fusicatenibacter sp.]